MRLLYNHARFIDYKRHKSGLERTFQKSPDAEKPALIHRKPNIQSRTLFVRLARYL